MDDGSGTGTMIAASAVHTPGEYLRTVMAAQVGHVLGKVDAFYAPGVGNAQANFINVGLNYSMAYEALRLVDMVDVPASCDHIYGLTFTDISNDHLMFDQSTATQALPGMTGVQIGGHYIDNEWETYIKHIREGRLDDDGNTKTAWPLQEFTIDCPGDAQTLGVDYIPGGNDAEDTPLTDPMKKYMYAHCVAQFQYASVGSNAWQGTYGIPLPGIEPGPAFTRTPSGTSTASTAPRRTTCARASSWASASASASGRTCPCSSRMCFLLGDSVVFFLSEALMPLVLAEQYAFASTQPEQHPRQPGDRGRRRAPRAGGAWPSATSP